jgi:hypothetical protein
MRTLLLASAATFALVLAHPGFAQTGTQPTNQPRAAGQASPTPADLSAPTDPTVPAAVQPQPSPAATAVPGTHEPFSRSASNIDPNDTRSMIAPRLPAPPVGPDATAPQLLHAARDALARNATGEAQEALERAETVLLDRSTEPSQASIPDGQRAVGLIAQARGALGRGDKAQATQAIDAALQAPDLMRSASSD